MATKTLPYISIAGTPQELVEIEMILVWLGYDKNSNYDEEWNDRAMIREYNFVNCYPLGQYNYLNKVGSHYPKVFHASQLTEIIEYVTNFKG